MITPLVLGNVSFPVNLIQGPLAGVSCAPFRRLTWAYSRPAFTCTEMISAKTLLQQNIPQRYIAKDPAEGPVCFQLAGNDPYELAEATKRATEYGANLIDLNCGCPVKKIRSKGAGSKLLSDGGKLFKLITAMKNNTTVPVSIKIRVQADIDHHNAEIAKVVSEAGVDFLVVHGRHWSEDYSQACRYDEIAFFVNALQIPVIGNGDIACVPSLKKMLDTGCSGVMISRASVGQPWLIAQLIAQLQQKSFSVPVAQERAKMFIEHATALANLLDNEKQALFQMRKLAKYYARDLAAKSNFCSTINKCEKIEDLIKSAQFYLGFSLDR